MILPLVVVVVLLSGVLSTLQSDAALTRVANRYLAFKAELLRNYFFSEWDVIASLGLAGQSAYRSAAEQSFRSYAYSLLHRPAEAIIVYDSTGKTLMDIRLESPAKSVGTTGVAGSPRAAGTPRAAGSAAQSDKGSGKPPPPGWFSEVLLGRPRVGVAFDIKPLGWTVAVADLRSAFFSDVDSIERTHILVLIVATLAVMIFLSIFIGHVSGPVERLAGTIAQITATNDLSARAEIEFGDEIGILAHRFNAMIAVLQENQRRIEAAMVAERHARELVAERERETLDLLGRVSDFRDEETGAHLKRIGELSALFSKLLGQSKEQQDVMRYGAPLHDIGKVGIPDSILQKPGRLTAEEFEGIKRHTSIGHEMLGAAQSEFLVVGAEIALTHHEKWDGTGYPAGLAGEAIPLAGRIVSIVDVFDALTSERRYKEAWSPDRALAHIVGESGRHFDPALVAVFEKNFAEFRACIHRNGNS